MDNIKFFDILISYCKDKIRDVIKYIIFILIFFIVYSLYHLPIGIFLYSVLLVLSCALLFSLYDFYNYYGRHKKLKDILNTIEFRLDGFPDGRTIIEKDYQDIITKVYEDKQKLLFNLDNRYDEMIDYYTMWAHQIKTPIAAFSMIVQTMDSGYQKTLMEQELFKINEYVEMVLHYVRLKSLSSDLKIQRYSLREIVKNIIRKYSASFIYKKISLNLEEFDCSIITDEKWISFVIEQVISNALKYTNEGSISIYMDENLKDTLVIEDTGIGIGKEDINMVFENGFTGYNGRMDKKSTGIGLYLCKKIITELSHKIYLTSEVGKGTKVYIDFSVNKIKMQ